MIRTYSLESNFVKVNRLFVLVYSNTDDAKRYTAQIYYLPKAVINSYNVILNGKNYDQSVDSDIKQYEEIRKLTTEQGEGYTTGCLLDIEYIKNHYKLIAIDLSRQKKIDANPKAIQKIEFIKQLKKY